MKSFATEFTDEGFVARVYPGVRVQSGAPVECFAALVTFVRLFLKGGRKSTGVNVFGYEAAVL